MPNLKKYQAAALAALAISLSSHVLAVEQTVTLPTLTSPTVDTSTLYTFHNIAGFDTSLGTLDSVQITLTLDSTPYVLVYNTSMKPEAYLKATTTTSALAHLTYHSAGGLGPLIVKSGSVEAGPFAGTLPGNTESSPLDGAETSMTNAISIFNPGTFYDATPGHSTYSLNTNLSEGQPFFTGMTKSGDPGVFFSGGDDIFESLSIEYFYTSAAVPEPSALSLVALSLGAFFLGRRLVAKNARS